MLVPCELISFMMLKISSTGSGANPWKFHEGINDGLLIILARCSIGCSPPDSRAAELIKAFPFKRGKLTKLDPWVLGFIRVFTGIGSFSRFWHSQWSENFRPSVRG
jgi:hypothetical protein